MSKTSLSAGEIVRELLISNDVLKSKVTKIFPVITDKAKLPYISYRKIGFSQDLTKSGRGADTITMQVSVYAESYKQSLELSELVRESLDYKQFVHYCGDLGVSFSSDFGTDCDPSEHLIMRSCNLTDCNETWMDDAFIQNMVFTIKI